MAVQFLRPASTRWHCSPNIGADVSHTSCEGLPHSGNRDYNVIIAVTQIRFLFFAFKSCTKPYMQGKEKATCETNVVQVRSRNLAAKE